MTQYSSCPGCGFNQKSNLFSGSHFYIYKCKNCGHKFCYKCGNVQGTITTTAICPECGSNGYEDGKVYLR
jgi:DNA-directed RNA polymerase subunit RPC12/RpoP